MEARVEGLADHNEGYCDLEGIEGRREKKEGLLTLCVLTCRKRFLYLSNVL